MPDPDTLVAGEALVDFLPSEPGPLSEVESFARRAGGAPANVATALASLGHPPWLLTRVGEDPFGAFLAATLADRGVPDRFVSTDPDRPTALAFVGHDDGSPAFTFYRENAADRHLRAESVPAETLAAVSRVVVGGVALAAEPARSAVHALVDRAREQDCTVVFDPNRRPELWADAGTYEAELRRMLGRADLVCAAVDDFAGTRFEAADPGAVARAVADAGPHAVALTLGADGALWHATGEGRWEAGTTSHPGYEVDAVDATGAGDAFVAGVLAALSEGAAAAPEVLSFANAVGALATTEPGAMAAQPDRAAVAALRESGGGSTPR